MGFNKLVYKPHEYYSYLRTINHSEIEVMFTKLAIVWGPHLAVWVLGLQRKFQDASKSKIWVVQLLVFFRPKNAAQVGV